ncbi:hypothetical protein BKA82DRAFT_4199056 [Pisolithus tinctorius]|nr:hypothetical protein BKA82DRAFT_4199056 [Pisolithus tinctorius]
MSDTSSSGEKRSMITRLFTSLQMTIRTLLVSSLSIPSVYDVSAINTREKLSSGMIKVYAAEVLGKLLVIQHFPFGSILYEGPPPPSGTGEESAHHTHIHGGGVIVWDTYPECCYDAARQNDGGT